MAETMVEGLSGFEIRKDVLAQIDRKLQTSCDLRDNDNYGQGYSAEITIKMKMYDMVVAEEQFFVSIPPKAEPPVSTEQVTVVPVEINETLVIEQEENLDAVRERMEAPIQVSQPASEEEENRMPERVRRKYTRRAAVEMTPMGGAVDVDSLPEGE